MPVKLTIFLAVFCYIGALVCAVLVVRNAVACSTVTVFSLSVST